MVSRFEQFKIDANKMGDEAHINLMQGNGSFEYRQQIVDLIEFQNKMNRQLITYMFGSIDKENDVYFQTVDSLCRLFVRCNMNFLKFLDEIDTEMRFFILYEIKTNKTLYANC